MPQLEEYLANAGCNTVAELIARVGQYEGITEVAIREAQSRYRNACRLGQEAYLPDFLQGWMSQFTPRATARCLRHRNPDTLYL